MNDNKVTELIEEAKKIANKNFCCNFSHFTVGAALLTKEGKIYTGFNIENDGIQAICAERTTFAKALTEGEKEFVAIAVVAKKLEDEYFTKTLPCGYCRQFISEYARPGFLIYTYDEKTNTVESYTIEELLPNSFRF